MVGEEDGESVGDSVGEPVGDWVGSPVGDTVGSNDLLGIPDGEIDGSQEGMRDGTSVGALVRQGPTSLHTSLDFFFFLLFALVLLESDPGTVFLHFLSSRHTYRCPLKRTASPSSYSYPRAQRSGQSAITCGQGPRGSQASTESAFDKSPG